VQLLRRSPKTRRIGKKEERNREKKGEEISRSGSKRRSSSSKPM
jgi:hypothetical protein